MKCMFCGKGEINMQCYLGGSKGTEVFFLSSGRITNHWTIDPNKCRITTTYTMAIFRCINRNICLTSTDENRRIITNPELEINKIHFLTDIGFNFSGGKMNEK